MDINHKINILKVAFDMSFDIGDNVSKQLEAYNEQKEWEAMEARWERAKAREVAERRLEAKINAYEHPPLVPEYGSPDTARALSTLLGAGVGVPLAGMAATGVGSMTKSPMLALIAALGTGGLSTAAGYGLGNVLGKNIEQDNVESKQHYDDMLARYLEAKSSRRR